MLKTSAGRKCANSLTWPPGRLDLPKFPTTSSGRLLTESEVHLDEKTGAVDRLAVRLRLGGYAFLPDRPRDSRPPVVL